MKRYKVFLAATVAACGLMGPSDSLASDPISGAACQVQELGTTSLSQDKVSIVACLRKEGGLDEYIWKNYMPDNALEADETTQTCQEGSLALYSQGRFTCKNLGSCNEGDVVVYSNGRFLCEKRAGYTFVKNYQYSLMGMTKLLPDEADWYGDGYATAYFTGKGLVDATNSPAGGLTLHQMEYTAKSTGRAKVLATVPIRYTQEADVWREWYGKDITKDVWQEAISAQIVITDSFGAYVTSTESVVSDPHPGTWVSSGDVGRVMLNFPITGGEKYTVTIKLVTNNKLGINAGNTASYGFAGTMAFGDHWTDGYVEIWENSVP